MRRLSWASHLMTRLQSPRHLLQQVVLLQRSKPRGTSSVARWRIPPLVLLTILHPKSCERSGNCFNMLSRQFFSEATRQVGYGPEADLWGVGCVLFEMLCGFPPFFSDDAHTTCRKIVQWRSYLKFPSDVSVEAPAMDLIRKLLCDGEDRLTIAECKVRLHLVLRACACDVKNSFAHHAFRPLFPHRSTPSSPTFPGLTCAC